MQFEQKNRGGDMKSGQEVELFTVATCGASPHPQRLAALNDLKTGITSLLEELEVTKRISEKLTAKMPRRPHHRFTVALSGCMNGCAMPETKSFGVVLAVIPEITETECSECFACVDACRRGAIVIRDGAPRVDIKLCDHCRDCVDACPTGTLIAGRQGFKIFIGGRLGRFHQIGYELFNITDRATLFKALEASVEHFLTNAIGQESFAALLNRTGLSPIYQRIYQGK
jgi:anaerobic sulfite reductase subunit C